MGLASSGVRMDETWLDMDGGITVKLTTREPAICGQFVTLYNFWANQHFHLTPEQFVKLVEWGQEQGIERLVEK